MAKIEKLEEFMLKVDDASSKMIRTIVLTLQAEIIKRTPVDTGWARSRWRIGDSLPDDMDPAQGNVLPMSMMTAADFDADDEVFVYNAVPYIRALEYGHSKQAAPGVMVADSVTMIRNAFGG